MDAYVNSAVKYLFTQSWQIAALAAVVGLVSFVLRNRSAHIRYLLWLIVLAKCIVPPLYSVRVPVLPDRPFSERLPGLDSPQHHRTVLLHELSHIARFDAAVNVLQILAQAIFWFHPFVWWVNKKIRQEREKCCDEMAVAQLSSLDYS